MRLLDLTLATPEENLALDEALLIEAEAAGEPLETLRLWEAIEPLVVVGRNSRLAEEVNIEACRRRNIKVLRRVSGGAAIVAGPGSLMYAVVLSYALRPALRPLDAAHRAVLETMLAAIRSFAPNAARRGTSDLAIAERKISGNSMRAKRHAFLYHGTLLYDFPLPLVGELLTMPPRQPDYRGQRSHGEFLTNVMADAESLRRAIAAAWHAESAGQSWPREQVRQLVDSRYDRREWHEER